MASVPRASEDARGAFHRELRETTRSTSILAGSLAVVLTLAWSPLDRALEPTNASAFLAVRVGIAVAIAMVLPLVVRRVVRDAGFEWAAFAMFAFLQIGLAWMLPRVVDSFEAYLLGFSLPIYASAIVVVWRWPFTVLLASVSIGGLSLFTLVSPIDFTLRRIVLVGFYLGTASLVAVVAQYLRYQSGWREFQVREALAEEQRHREVLLAHLGRLSREDDLTGLTNRRGWQEALEEAFAACRRRGGDLAVVLCDLDHFKRINDEHGHAAGDEVLRRVAAVLQDAVRSTDTVARLGGDEFAVIVPRADHETAATIAVRVVTGVRDAVLCDLGVPGITASVGVAMLDAGDEDIEALVHRADAEMYRAKADRDAAWMAGMRRDADGDHLAPAGREVAPAT